MKKQGLNTTLKQLGPDAKKYAEALKNKCVKVYHYAPPNGKKYVVCHSTWNWHPDEEFNVEHTWERWYMSDAEPEIKYADYDGPIIVHGHTPVALGGEYEERVNGKLIGYCLDAGCAYGGPEAGLRIMCLTTGQIFEVPNLD